MKTFDEACERILVRRITAGQMDEVPPDMADASDKFKSLHEEVQVHSHTLTFVSILLRIAEENDVSMEAILSVAFSHGIAVGIEMERQELP